MFGFYLVIVLAECRAQTETSQMQKKWLRRTKTGIDLAWDGFRRSRIKALCQRLGIDYTDDPKLETEMWAQIGDYLALNEPEFRKTGAGAREIPETKECRLVEIVDPMKAAWKSEGKKFRDIDIINFLLKDEKFNAQFPGTKEPKSLLYQLSRGRKRLRDNRDDRADDARGEDDYDEFVELRAQRDNCKKSV